MTNPVAAGTVHDLQKAAAPTGSRILTQFKAAREHDRRQAAAQRELSAAVAAFRRHGRATSHRMPMPAAAAPQPAFAVVSGERAFAAAQTDRLATSWIGFSTGINADLEMALTTMRARSRDWSVNTEQGERFLELVADNVVGSDPPMLRVRAKLGSGSKELDTAANAAVEEAWATWCKRGVCEATGELSFGQVCRTVMRTTARDGEFLARRIRDRSLPFGFRLQLLDVDRINTTMNLAPAAPGATAIRLGVEIDPLGRKQALHLYNRHPGDAGAGVALAGVSNRVPIDQVLHGFVLKREEQVRGYPWSAPVLKRANTLATFEGHALDAAKIGAAKMGFYTVDKDAVSTETTWDAMKDATGELMQDVETGMLEALPPGVDFKPFDPDYPHQFFAPFVTEFKRDVASGLNVAHHNLSGNMTGVNYSSARIAELAERRHWRARQAWFIDSFVRPVFEDWLRMALLTGSILLPSGAALPADRFDKFASAASFQPPGWPWVDPEADIKTAAIAATYDIRSLRAITDEQGVNLEQTLVDKKHLLDMYGELGLPVPPWMSGGTAVFTTGVPQPTPAPAPVETDTTGAAA